MGEQTGRKLVPQDVYNAYNGKDLDHFASLLADDYVFESGAGGKIDKAAFLGFIEQSWKTYPDGKITAVRDVTEGDSAVGEAIFEGTHQGDWMGIPGTGKQVTFPFAEIFGFRGDKVTLMKVYSDTISVVRQIGSVPIGYLSQ